MTADEPLTCAGCGKQLRRSSRSLPQGKATCVPCRKSTGDPNRAATPQAPPAAPLDNRKAGPVERTVREDIEALGGLVGVEPTLAEMAYRLARDIDAGGGDDGRLLPQLNKELRATLKQLVDGRPADDDDDDLADLATPV